MKYTSKVGERGQVVIPKAIRDTLGLGKNSSVEFELDGASISLKPARDRAMRDFELALKRYGGSLRREFLADGYKSVDQYLDASRGFDETRRK